MLVPILESKASVKQPDAGGASTNNSTDGATVGPGTTTPNSSTVDELSQAPNSFSVFASIQSGPGPSRAMTARAELGRIDQFMRKITRKSDQRVYNECPEATPTGIRAELERLAAKANLLELRERSRLRVDLRERIDTFNSVVVVFTYFMPLSFVGPSVRKFWGSLKLLLDVSFGPL